MSYKVFQLPEFFSGFKCFHNSHTVSRIIIILINVPNRSVQMSHINYVTQNKTRKKLQHNALQKNKQQHEQQDSATSVKTLQPPLASGL